MLRVFIDPVKYFCRYRVFFRLLAVPLARRKWSANGKINSELRLQLSAVAPLRCNFLADYVWRAWRSKLNLRGTARTLSLCKIKLTFLINVFISFHIYGTVNFLRPASLMPADRRKLAPAHHSSRAVEKLNYYGLNWHICKKRIKLAAHERVPIGRSLCMN